MSARPELKELSDEQNEKEKLKYMDFLKGLVYQYLNYRHGKLAADKVVELKRKVKHSENYE